MNDTVESQLVWIKGEAVGVDDKLFDEIFLMTRSLFNDTIKSIRKNNLASDNRVADKVRRELNTKLSVNNYRVFYQLCHAFLNPKTKKQRIDFNPNKVKRIVGELGKTGIFSIAGKRFYHTWVEPEEYSEINILPRPVAVMEYLIDEKGHRTYFLSKLCDELFCYSTEGLCSWLYDKSKNHGRKTNRGTHHNRFIYIPGKKII